MRAVVVAFCLALGLGAIYLLDSGKDCTHRLRQVVVRFSIVALSLTAAALIIHGVLPAPMTAVPSVAEILHQASETLLAHAGNDVSHSAQYDGWYDMPVAVRAAIVAVLFVSAAWFAWWIDTKADRTRC